MLLRLFTTNRWSDQVCTVAQGLSVRRKFPVVFCVCDWRKRIKHTIFRSEAVSGRTSRSKDRTLQGLELTKLSFFHVAATGFQHSRAPARVPSRAPSDASPRFEVGSVKTICLALRAR